jgi:hypothetical protein
MLFWPFLVVLLVYHKYLADASILYATQIILKTFHILKFEQIHETSFLPFLPKKEHFCREKNLFSFPQCTKGKMVFCRWGQELRIWKLQFILTNLNWLNFNLKDWDHKKKYFFPCPLYVILEEPSSDPCYPIRTVRGKISEQHVCIPQDKGSIDLCL